MNDTDKLESLRLSLNNLVKELDDDKNKALLKLFARLTKDQEAMAVK